MCGLHVNNFSVLLVPSEDVAGNALNCLCGLDLLRLPILLAEHICLKMFCLHIYNASLFGIADPNKENGMLIQLQQIKHPFNDFQAHLLKSGVLRYHSLLPPVSN